MDDPSRFTSINEYYTFIYAISYMMLVELGIWIYNFKGWLKRPDKKNNDYGTILIVMLGCWGSFYFSTYFRSQQFIQIAGEILFMEFPSYRVALLPYEAHEYLRPHLSVDLTGKLRDWLSPTKRIKQMFLLVKSRSQTFLFVYAGAN